MAWCRRCSIILLLIVLTSACGSPQTGQTIPGAAGTSATLNIFAAASLTEAFEAIGAAFEAEHPGTDVVFNFAGSQQLAQQINQGAPADVFASANQRQMDVVVNAGHIIAGTQQIFVRNRLVVVYPKDNPAKLQQLQDLAKPGVKIVLAAPAVPIGTYALEFLAKASSLPEYTTSYSPTVLANVVSYEENVRSVLSKVALGEVDAGIVYSSDITKDAASQVKRLEIPDALNTIAAYPIAPMAHTQQASLAQEFVAYVLSSKGQATLVEYGFLPARS